MKLYSRKSDAIRGAKRTLKNEKAEEGVDYKLITKDSQYGFEAIEEDVIYGNEGDLESGLEGALKKVDKKKTTKKPAVPKTKKAVTLKEIENRKEVEEIIEKKTKIPDGVLIDLKKEDKKAILRESSAEKPTKLVWHIADEMQGAKRKDVINECVKRGIAFFTARTQYQQWYSIKKEMAERTNKK